MRASILLRAQGVAVYVHMKQALGLPFAEAPCMRCKFVASTVDCTGNVDTIDTRVVVCCVLEAKADLRCCCRPEYSRLAATPVPRKGA